jgi:hypothetical protein
MDNARVAKIIADLCTLILFIGVPAAASAQGTGPHLNGIADVTLFPGKTSAQTLTATDPDTDQLTFYKVSGPDYVTAASTPQYGGHWGELTVAPGAGDVGSTTATIGVSDGVSSDQKTIDINVLDPSPSSTFLRLDSDPNDFIGLGQHYLFTTEDGTLGAGGFPGGASGPGNASFGFDSPTHSWHGDFVAPSLGPGLYTDDVYVSNDGSQPSLDVYGDGRGCDVATGYFEIKEIVYGKNGAVISLWATFEQHCNGSDAALRGEIRFNAHAPVDVDTNLHWSVERTKPLSFEVLATDLDGAPLSLTAPTLPAGASFTDNGNNTGLFAWTPAFDQRGTHQASFEARDAAGNTDLANTTISVTGSTQARISSDPGDFVGGGLQYLYRPPGAQIRVVYQFGGLTYHVYDDSQGVWDITFSQPAGTPLAPGVYTNIGFFPFQSPAQAGISITHNSSVAGVASGRVEIKQVDLPPDGPVRSYWMTFEIVQNDGRVLSGDLRFDADVVVDLEAPFVSAVDETSPLQIHVTATDGYGRHVTLSAEDLPSGATFQDGGDDTGVLAWTPSFSQAGSYAVTFHADAGGGVTASARTRITVNNLNRAPIADAGGPYYGEPNVPIAFDGSGSSDPDGDPISLGWAFGDGFAGYGTKTAHAYAVPGVYSVTLYVHDRFAEARDSTTATVTGARAFTMGGDRNIRLGSGKPTWCAQIEAQQNLFVPEDVDLASIVLKTDGTTGSVAEIQAVADGLSHPDDQDGDGVPEVTTCFSKEDLRLLFGLVRGTQSVPVRIEGHLLSGAPFGAELEVLVIGSTGTAALAASPNPFNPHTTVTFYMASQGHVRLQVFDAAGRLVRTLFDGSRSAGYHDVLWTGETEHGSRAPSGVYYLELDSVAGSSRRSIVLVR